MIPQYLKKRIPLCLKRFAKCILKPGKLKVQGPVLGDHPYGGPEDSSITFAMIVMSTFNINIPNAFQTSTLGFCRGFAQIGVRYQLVSTFEVERALPQLRNPFVFLSVYEYQEMSKAAIKVLRNYPHFVWVPANEDVYQKIYEPYGITYYGLPQEVYRRVLESEPDFVWAPVPPSGLEFFSTWQDLGFRVESLPLACDTARYYPEPQNRRYSDVKMAYVSGGYRPKKAIQFEKYLRPYEDVLTVFGYRYWPYKGYRGLLPEDDERVLYQNARVCPAISEPDAAVIGDIVERAFKVIGSGGLAITDVVPFYRKLFKPDELLVPRNLDEYHDMVQQALTDDDFNRHYREKGYQAIQKRHTYAHRARTILDYLGIHLEQA
jgi:hypothetical protein